MPQATQEFLYLIQNGENQFVEFKSSFQKEVIESVVAFANHKGGKIFIGIDDNSKNELLELIEKHHNLRANEISESLQVPLSTVQRWLKQLQR